MAVSADGYSRTVNWLKIILPLIALAILSTLFMVSRTIDPSQTIPYADVDIDALTSGQRVGQPNFTAMTTDGTAISMRADLVHPDAEDNGRISADRPVVVVELDVGQRIRVTAETAVLDQAAQRADLTGDVRLETSDGYVIWTSGLSAWLNETRVESQGRIEADGPLGKLHAGQMVLTQSEGVDGPYLLRFENGVKVVYQP